MNKTDIGTLIVELAEVNQYLKDNNINRYEVYCFPQIWTNTSGGFESIGGSTVVTHNTIVILEKPSRIYHIFFKGEYGYTVDHNNRFIYDLNNHDIAGVNTQKNRYHKGDIKYE